MKRCSIIILTCNALHYTKNCLNSLVKYTKAPYELIIIDNASTDGTRSFLSSFQQRINTNHKVVPYSTSKKNNYSSHNKMYNPQTLNRYQPLRTIIHHNPSNYGYAKGCNQGAALAIGDSLLFLNSDTLVGKNWLENLLYCLHSNSQIAAVNPCSNFNPYAQINNSLQGLNEIQNFMAEYNRKNPAKWRDSESASGFCLLVKKEIFQKAKGFDEDFEIGCYEDTDLTRRFHQMGYRNVLARDTYVHHFGNKSFQANGLDLSYYMEINKKKYYQKHLQ